MSIEQDSNLESIPNFVYRGEVWPADSVFNDPHFFDRVLTPGTEKGSNPDPNEHGVYTTTNLKMVLQTDYSNTTKGSIELTERVKSGRKGFLNSLPLPGIGIVYKINTEETEIRKPQIAPVFQGHYNNGFMGEEYIADEVPVDAYEVIAITVSTGSRSNDKRIFKIEDFENREAMLEKAAEYYDERKTITREIVEELNNLDPNLKLEIYVVDQILKKLNS